MRPLTLCLALLSVVLVGAQRSKDDLAKKDKEKLQGNWTVISILPAGGGSDDVKLVFAGDKLTSYVDKKEQAQLTYVLDPTKMPPSIDITGVSGADKGKSFPGIYMVEKDELKICVSMDEENPKRPTEFKAAAENKKTLIVLKRVKE